MDEGHWYLLQAKGWTSSEILAGILGGTAVLTLFLVWESRARRPLLATRYFGNLHFTAGSLSLTAQFFGFFGFIAIFMQYLQLVHGWSPLQAACALLAMPLGLMPTARLAPRLLPRLGQAKMCDTGLLLMATALYWLSRSSIDTPYWQLALGLLPLGIGSGLAMPPATTAITEALPDAEQGVASAMNDLARELGGALGIAVMSSVLTSTYRSHLQLPETPGRIVEAARESVAVATHLGEAGVPAPVAEHVAAVARRAFVDGLADALQVAALVDLTAAVLVVALLGLARRR